MKIEISHHIDASEPDAQGMYDWHYEYDIFSFSDEQLQLIARSYTDTPHEAHFIGMERRHQQLNIADELDHPMVRAAIDHLRSAGKTEINFLGAGGYEAVPD